MYTLQKFVRRERIQRYFEEGWKSPYGLSYQFTTRTSGKEGIINDSRIMYMVRDLHVISIVVSGTEIPQLV